MVIYLGHSTAFNYEEALYLPLKNSALWAQHSFILPHVNQADPAPTKTLIQTVDLMVAEVSYPSTGLGIELALPSSTFMLIITLSVPSTVTLKKIDISIFLLQYIIVL